MITDLSKLDIKAIFAVIDLIEIPIFVIEVGSEHLKFAKFNKHHEEVVGILSSDVAGKTAHDFLPSRVANTLEGNYRHCVSTGMAYQYDELLTLQGEENWWSTTLSPVKDDSGLVKYIIGASSNVDKEKNSAIKLLEENAKLKRQNDDICTLTALAAHDLRPAIGNVRNFCELILDGFQDMGDGKLDQLQTIHSISDTMTTYVERVLTHANSVNLDRIDESRFDLGHVVRGVIAVSDPQSNLDITYPTGATVGEEIVFQIILRNLIDNATRHAHTHIAIEVEESSERAGYLMLRVCDDGDGFPGGVDGFRSHFEKREDQAFDTTTGFGLRAVWQLVEARGGHFWLSPPTEGSGAALCVSLPGTLSEFVEPTVPVFNTKVNSAA